MEPNPAGRFAANEQASVMKRPLPEIGRALPQVASARSLPEAPTAPARNTTPPRPSRSMKSRAGAVSSMLGLRGRNRTREPSIEQVRATLITHFEGMGTQEAAGFISIIMEEEDLSCLLEVAKDEGVSLPAAPKPPRQNRSSPRGKPPSLQGLGFSNVGKAPPALPQSPGSRSRLEATFKTAAKTGNATGAASDELSTSQVKAFFASIGVNVDDEWVQRCMDAYDADNSGTISMDEFALLVEQLAPQKLDEPTRSGKSLRKVTDKWNSMVNKHGPATELPKNLTDFRAMSKGKQWIAVVGFGGWCIILVLFVLQLVAALIEEECVEPPLPVTVCTDRMATSFGSDVEPAVDIVVVVDTSSSMIPLSNIGIQNNLMSYIESLSTNSSSIGDRWQLIVANSEDGCHNSGFLNYNIPGSQQLFMDAATTWVGEQYPFTEIGLLSAAKAVEQTGPGQCNEGFLRDNALLHVVLVSDAATPWESLLNRLAAVKDNDPRRLRVSTFRNFKFSAHPYQYNSEHFVDANGVFENPNVTFGEPFMPESPPAGWGYAQAAAGVSSTGTTISTEGLDADIFTPSWVRSCYAMRGDDAGVMTLQPVGPTCYGNETLGVCAQAVEVPVATPIPVGGVCDLELNGAGGDEGYYQTFAANNGGFELSIEYQTYSQEDNVIVCQGDCPATGTQLDCTWDSSETGLDSNGIDNNCVLWDSGCVGTQGTWQHVMLLPLLLNSNITLKVHPNCFGGYGTAWNLGATCVIPPAPPPPVIVYSPPIPSCNSVNVPRCDTGNFGAGSTGELMCYRDYIQELSHEVKVFGTYPAPALPLYANYSNLQLSLGTVIQPGPAVLPDGSSNPACAESPGGCTWGFVEPTHGDSQAVVQFACTECSDPNFYDGGASNIHIEWDENKVGGCVTTSYPPCPDDDLPFWYWLLFVLLLIVIWCATYTKVTSASASAVEEVLGHEFTVYVKDFNGDVHELLITEQMNISDIKALLERVTEVDLDTIHLFNEAFSDQQLEGRMMCRDCGLIPTRPGQNATLTMMVTWTIFVREELPESSVLEQARKLGMDTSVKLHTLEGVEKHWKVESVKLRIEQITGIPLADQKLCVVLPTHNRPLDDGYKLPDYFPDVRNRCELVLYDQDPERKIRAFQKAEAEGKKTMGADSVVSMARMFQAGYVPGSSLSDLQEGSLTARKTAYYATFFKTERDIRDGAGGLGATSRANLAARAHRARHLHGERGAVARP